ncbi:hypothetical protein PROFUN_14597 [Planoprotostelium fungivorum]|uniref:Uncharacterized protein n=1 Tax=Planoprotostelium fungivorum TaxID=1890364 RepID=A0A2P6MZG5_9EUKA|nr:hypothetical protein PROFUN_14597 [Planoprotostelium fungivorum]
MLLLRLRQALVLDRFTNILSGKEGPLLHEEGDPQRIIFSIGSWQDNELYLEDLHPEETMKLGFRIHLDDEEQPQMIHLKDGCVLMITEGDRTHLHMKFSKPSGPTANRFTEDASHSLQFSTLKNSSPERQLPPTQVSSMDITSTSVGQPAVSIISACTSYVQSLWFRGPRTPIEEETASSADESTEETSKEETEGVFIQRDEETKKVESTAAVLESKADSPSTKAKAMNDPKETQADREDLFERSIRRAPQSPVKSAPEEPSCFSLSPPPRMLNRRTIRSSNSVSTLPPAQIHPQLPSHLVTPENLTDSSGAYYSALSNSPSPEGPSAHRPPASQAPVDSPSGMLFNFSSPGSVQTVTPVRSQSSGGPPASVVHTSFGPHTPADSPCEDIPIMSSPHPRREITLSSTVPAIPTPLRVRSSRGLEISPAYVALHEGLVSIMSSDECHPCTPGVYPKGELRSRLDISLMLEAVDVDSKKFSHTTESSFDSSSSTEHSVYSPSSSVGSIVSPSVRVKLMDQLRDVSPITHPAPTASVNHIYPQPSDSENAIRQALMPSDSTDTVCAAELKSGVHKGKKCGRELPCIENCPFIVYRQDVGTEVPSVSLYSSSSVIMNVHRGNPFTSNTATRNEAAVTFTWNIAAGYGCCLTASNSGGVIDNTSAINNTTISSNNASSKKEPCWSGNSAVYCGALYLLASGGIIHLLVDGMDVRNNTACSGASFPQLALQEWVFEYSIEYSFI